MLAYEAFSIRVPMVTVHVLDMLSVRGVPAKGFGTVRTKVRAVTGVFTLMALEVGFCHKGLVAFLAAEFFFIGMTFLVYLKTFLAGKLLKADVT